VDNAWTNEAAKLSTFRPLRKHGFPHTLEARQHIDFQSINGEKKLSTPPTTTTNFFSKTEQQA
jgi:hypothetical protein